MRTIVRSLLIYRLTGSIALLGLMSLVHALPGILFPLFGGVIADRLPKKYVLILGHVGSLTTTLVVAISLTMGFLSADRPGSWWILIGSSFINAIVSSLTMPSRQAIISELVEPEELMNAISLINVGRSVLRLSSPAIAGILIDILGFEPVYYLTCGITAISLIITSFLPITGTFERKSQSIISQIKAGLRYVRGETTLIFILIFTLVMAMLSAPYMRLMPIFADDILKVGATGMGILISASAAGALVGSLFLASLPNKKRGVILISSAVLLGIALAVFAFSHNWYISLASIVFVGLGHTMRMTLSNTLIQNYSATNYRGRVMSLYSMEEGLTSLGVFGAAMLAEVVGVSITVGSLALVLVVIALLALIFLPRLRKLE
jgi:MFS family permease